MGGGASSQASVVVAQQGDIAPSTKSETINGLLKKTYSLKNDIALRDIGLIRHERHKFMKAHNVIIDNLTSRSKKQLRRTVAINSSVLEDVPLLSKSYGNFLASLMMSKDSLDMSIIMTALEQSPPNINIIVFVLSTCSSDEVNLLNQNYAAANGQASLFTKLCDYIPEDSPLKKLWNMILAHSTDDKVEADKSLASHQASCLFSLLHYKESLRPEEKEITEKRDDEIIAYLSCGSRCHRSAILTSYESQFGEYLGNATETRYDLIPGLAIHLWMLPLPEAVADFLYHHCKDDHGMENSLESANVHTDSKKQLGELAVLAIARYDKNFLSLVDECCRKHHLTSIWNLIEPLLPVIQSHHLRKAVFSWLYQHAPDSNLDTQLPEFIEEHGNLDEILETVDSTKKFTTFLEEQNTELSEFIKTNLPLQKTFSNHEFDNTCPPPRIGSMTSTPAAIGSPGKLSMPNSPFPEDAESTPVKSPSEAHHGSDHKHHYHHHHKPIVSWSEGKPLKEVQMVHDYVRYLIQRHDRMGYGILPSYIFWSVIFDLNLSEYGYTKDIILKLRAKYNWGSNGFIIYGGVMSELTRSIYCTVEKSGASVHDVFEALINGEHHHALTDQTLQTVPLSKVSADISEDHFGSKVEKYVFDSFKAFDFDKNGTLNQEEFLHLLDAMNLGYSLEENMELFKQWNTSGNGELMWKELCIQCRETFAEMLEVGNPRHAWIGVVDHSTLELFWYNVCDHQSRWMVEGDQELYAPKYLLRPGTCEDNGTSPCHQNLSIDVRQSNKKFSLQFAPEEGSDTKVANPQQKKSPMSAIPFNLET